LPRIYAFYVTGISRRRSLCYAIDRRHYAATLRQSHYATTEPRRLITDYAYFIVADAFHAITLPRAGHYADAIITPELMPAELLRWLTMNITLYLMFTPLFTLDYADATPREKFSIIILRRFDAD